MHLTQNGPSKCSSSSNESIEELNQGLIANETLYQTEL
jgi:hypothetical protein